MDSPVYYLTGPKFFDCLRLAHQLGDVSPNIKIWVVEWGHEPRGERQEGDRWIVLADELPADGVPLPVGATVLSAAAAQQWVDGFLRCREDVA